MRNPMLCGLICLLAACDDDGAKSGGGAGINGSSAGASSGGAAGNAGAGNSGGSNAGAGNGGAGNSGGSNAGAGNGGVSNAGASGKAGTSCEGRVICDDFEAHAAGEPPAAPWRAATNKGSVAVDSTRAHSGTKAVKVATSGLPTNCRDMGGCYQQAFVTVEGAPYFPLPNNVVYGRLWMYMDSAAKDGVHWTHIQGSGPLASREGVTALYRYGGMHQQKLMANYETLNAASDCWNNVETKMPEGRWACMEWRFNGPNNEMNFWLDGVAVPELTVVQKGQGCIGHDINDEWLAPTFEKMSLGWESYQQDEPRQAWIDDVVIDDERIGCD